MKKRCVLTLTDDQLAKLIKGYVDFDSIVHHAPNLLRYPIEIRYKVIGTLEDIGISVKENPDGRVLRSVRLECTDKNGTYYVLCHIIASSDENAFRVFVGPLYKVVEGIDPFSAESDIELTSEQVSLLNDEYMKNILKK